MTDIEHERAITTISEALGGKVVSRIFKMYPARFLDQENEVRERRQPVTGVPDNPARLPPIELPEIPSDMRLDWTHDHWAGARVTPCAHCGRPALLFDDAGRPAHKVCVEGALAQLMQTNRGSAA